MPEKGYRLLLESEVKNGIPLGTEYSASGGAWCFFPECICKAGQSMPEEYHNLYFRTKAPLPDVPDDVFSALMSLVK